MAVGTATGRVSYVGNGTADTFAYTFRVASAADLRVIVIDAAGVETVLALTTQYTVTGAGLDAGGSITLVYNAAWPWVDSGNDLVTGYTLVIVPRPALTQVSSYRNQGRYSGTAAEADLDLAREVDIAQQDQIDASLQIPEGEARSATKRTLPTALARANKIFTWDASGNPTATASIIGGAILPGGTSLAALRLIVGTTANQAAQVIGHTVAGDGGGGTFSWDSASVAADDDGMVVRPTAIDSLSPGRWRRLVSDGAVLSSWFGPTRIGLQTCMTNHRKVVISRDYDFSAENTRVNVPASTDVWSNGHTITGPGFTITGDDVRIIGVGFSNHQASGTTPVSGIFATNVEKIEIIGCRFATSIVSLVNNTATVRRGVAIRGCRFTGDYTLWVAAAGPNVIYVVGFYDTRITDNEMVLTAPYRFIKVQASSIYLVAADNVGDAYCSRVIITGNTLSGTMSTALKQVLDAYSGMGECVIANNTIKVTGASSIIEQKNDGGTGPTSSKTRNLIIANNYLEGNGDRLIFFYGAYGMTYESDAQIVLISNNILRHLKDAIGTYAVECRGLHNVVMDGNQVDSINTDPAYYPLRARNCKCVSITNNGLTIGSITIDDGANTSTGVPYPLPTKLIQVSGNTLADFRGGAGVYVVNITGCDAIVVNNNALRSASGALPTQGVVWINTSTVVNLIVTGNHGKTGLSTYDRLFTQGSTISGRKNETGNSWNNVNVRGTAGNTAIAFGDATSGGSELTFDADVNVVVTGASKNVAVGGTLPGSFNANGLTGTERTLSFTTDHSSRWLVRCSGDAEAGANVGSNFKLSCYSDTGVFIDSPLEISRVAGAGALFSRPLRSLGEVRGATLRADNLTSARVPYYASTELVDSGDLTFSGSTSVNLLCGGTLPGNMLVNGAAATDRSFRIRTAGVDRWAIRGDNVAEGGTNAGTGFKLSAYDDAGALIDTPFEIVRASNGTMTIRRPITMVNAIRYAVLAQSALSATINMGLSDICRLAHPSAQTVTTISIAGTGQRITLIFTNGFTTIQNNSTIKLAGGVDFVGTADDTLSLVYESTSAVWRETGRSLN